MPYKNPTDKAAYNKRYREANRERMRNLYREWAARNPDRRREHDALDRARHPYEIEARQLANRAVALGLLDRQPCEYGDGCEGAVHMHHDDYDLPFHVRFLCAKHHGAEHRLI